MGLSEMREAGHDSRTVVGWLAWSCGLIPEPEPLRPGDLLPHFSFEVLKREPTQLESLNVLG